MIICVHPLKDSFIGVSRHYKIGHGWVAVDGGMCLDQDRIAPDIACIADHHMESAVWESLERLGGIKRDNSWTVSDYYKTMDDILNKLYT